MLEIYVELWMFHVFAEPFPPQNFNPGVNLKFEDRPPSPCWRDFEICWKYVENMKKYMKNVWTWKSSNSPIGSCTFKIPSFLSYRLWDLEKFQGFFFDMFHVFSPSLHMYQNWIWQAPSPRWRHICENVHSEKCIIISSPLPKVGFREGPPPPRNWDLEKFRNIALPLAVFRG